MPPDKLPDPLRAGPERAVGSTTDEVQIAGQVAADADGEVETVEVRVEDGEEAREVGCRGGGAVDDLVDGHLGVFVFDWAEGRGGRSAEIAVQVGGGGPGR